MDKNRLLYLKKRKKDLELDIEMWTDYINKSNPQTWTKETGVGRSYQARRKKRFSAVHDSYISEKTNYIEKCKECLELVCSELDQIENKQNNIN